MAAEMVQFYCQNASCGNFDLYLHYCNILLYLNCRAVADPGEGAGGLAPRLILDQTKARRAEKYFWRLPPVSQGLGDRLPPPPYFKV